MNLPVVHIGRNLTHSENEGDSDTEISGGPPKQVKGQLEQVTVHMCCNSGTKVQLCRISSLFVWCILFWLHA